LEFIANDDDDFKKFTETVVTDDESDLDDWDEEPPGGDDEPETEPDFNYFDPCNMQSRPPPDALQALGRCGRPAQRTNNKEKSFDESYRTLWKSVLYFALLCGPSGDWLDDRHAVGTFTPCEFDPTFRNTSSTTARCGNCSPACDRRYQGSIVWQVVKVAPGTLRRWRFTADIPKSNPKQEG
jgi:hypothetical protein